MIFLAIVPCYYFKLSWWGGPLTPILNYGNISALFLRPRLLDQQKLTRAQIGPVEFLGEKLPYEEKSTRCVMIISCQGDFKEQVQKLAKYLLYTTKNWWKKDQFCVRSVRSL